MNNFGVIELASLKTTAAPGWAYVPDTGQVSHAVALQPANRKRSRTAANGGLSLGDQSARQAAKVRKEVEALDRDCGRDQSIPLPARSGRAQGKHTPNVRKIMQSQKTFANHLDDLLAMQALAEVNPSVQTNTARAGASTSGSSKRQTATSKKDSMSSASAKQNRFACTHQDDQDVTLVDIMDAKNSAALPPPTFPSDENPLLVTRVPAMPSVDKLGQLLAHPPLTYLEACGILGKDDRYPTRSFCELCGYWGRVRCIKCGSRICALECLEAHKEDCFKRYGL